MNTTSMRSPLRLAIIFVVHSTEQLQSLVALMPLDNVNLHLHLCVHYARIGDEHGSLE